MALIMLDGDPVPWDRIVGGDVFVDRTYPEYRVRHGTCHLQRFDATGRLEKLVVDAERVTVTYPAEGQV